MYTMELTDLEKARLKLKIEWEGGLENFLHWGIPTRLKDIYKTEVDAVIQIIDKKVWTKKQKAVLYDLSNKIDLLLKDVDAEKYTDDELNSVDYVLDCF